MLNPNQLVSWEIDEQQKPIKEGEGGGVERKFSGGGRNWSGGGRK